MTDTFEVFNDETEDAPAGALLLPSGGFTDSGAMLVVKPDEDNQSGLCIAAECTIPGKATGQASFRNDALVVIDPDSDIPAQGDTVGSQAGSFFALAGNTGFQVVGAGYPWSYVVRVQASVAAAVSAWKEPVRVATTVNGTLSSAFENGDTVDGITLATGNRILIKNQSTSQDNGIYTVNASGSPTRATDADSGTELLGATVFVSEGTTNADTAWSCTANATITIGSTSLPWVKIGPRVFDQAYGGGVTINADTTWFTTGQTITVPRTGTYEVTAGYFYSAGVNGISGASKILEGRIYNTTAALVASTASGSIPNGSVTIVDINLAVTTASGYMEVTYRLVLTAGDTIRSEARRLPISGTWGTVSVTMGLTYKEL